MVRDNLTDDTVCPSNLPVIRVTVIRSEGLPSNRLRKSVAVAIPKNNIPVQQHKTNMINEEWNKTQNDAPFVAFYNMRAVTFVLPDEMANVSIAGTRDRKHCG